MAHRKKKRKPKNSNVKIQQQTNETELTSELKLQWLKLLTAIFTTLGSVFMCFKDYLMKIFS